MAACQVVGNGQFGRAARCQHCGRDGASDGVSRRRWSSAFLALIALWLGAVATSASASPAPDVREWPLDKAHLDAAQLWKLSEGAGVIVALVDSGVDSNHPDLAGQVLRGSDFTSAGGVGQVDTSSDSHGTSVAGVIAATGRRRLVGLAPKARLLPVRVSDGGSIDPVAAAEGVSYAVDHGAKVINMSLTSRTDNPQLRAAVNYALAHDVVVVAAAGNDGGNGNPAEYPAALPGVVAVTGTEPSGGLWPGGETGQYVALAAPGDDIYSTSNRGGYLTAAGTSYSAAYVSAAAALLRARFPHESAAKTIARLTGTARSTPDVTSRVRFGVVDPRAALIAPTPAASNNPLLTTPSAATPASATSQTGKKSGGGWLIAIGAVTAGMAVAVGVFLWWRRARGPRSVAGGRSVSAGKRSPAARPRQRRRR